jgi:hypothetical protein
MEGDVLELKMDLQHIKELLQNIQRIFGQFYENNYGWMTLQCIVTWIVICRSANYVSKNAKNMALI